ncbi:MAG: IclR family transcriptional regulator [Lawsonibacter sp.]
MANSAENSSVRVVDRTLNIIEALAGAPRGMPLNALSESVGLHKATVYRLLQSLVGRHYVIKDEESGKYRLTMRLFDLGSQILGGFNLLGVARPFLEKISDETHEVVHLAARDNTEIVYLYKEDPNSNVVQMESRVGARNPLYCTGLGKSILAALSDTELETVWKNSSVTARTPRTILSLEDMRKDLAEARRLGYAIDDEEGEVGVRCVAAPIRDSYGTPFAAISIAAATQRMPAETIRHYGQIVISATDSISQLFGYAETSRLNSGNPDD